MVVAAPASSESETGTPVLDQEQVCAQLQQLAAFLAALAGVEDPEAQAVVMAKQQQRRLLQEALAALQPLKARLTAAVRGRGRARLQAQVVTGQSQLCKLLCLRKRTI